MIEEVGRLREPNGFQSLSSVTTSPGTGMVAFETVLITRPVFASTYHFTFVPSLTATFWLVLLAYVTPPLLWLAAGGLTTPRAEQFSMVFQSVAMVGPP